MGRKFFTGAALAVIVWSLAGISSASTASLDRKFGNDGHSVTGFGSSRELRQGRATIQGFDQEGNFFVWSRGSSGRSPQTIHRFDPDGHLDPVFAGFSHEVAAKSSASTVLPTGNLLVARRGLIASYLPDGSLDRSFGRNGTIEFPGVATSMLPVGKGSFVVGSTSSSRGAARVNRYSNTGRRLAGRLVHASEVRVDDVSPRGEMAAVLSWYYDDYPPSTRFILLNRDLKPTVIRGDQEFGPGMDEVAFRRDGYLLRAYRYGVFALGAKGKVDSEFGNEGGIFCPTEDPPLNWYLTAFDVGLDGSIVGLGARQQGCRGPVRFLPDGHLDSSFGDNGVAEHPDFISDQVVLDGRSRVLVTGWSKDAGGLAVTRFTRHGELDAEFGNGGTTSVRIPIARSDRPRDSVIQKDGKLVVAGNSECARKNCADFSLVRYLRNGRIDPSFGRKGTAFFGSDQPDVLNSVALQPDGRILAAGASDGTAVVMRLNSDGRLDRSFGLEGEGIQTINPAGLGGRHSRLSDIAIQSDGRILGAGTVACAGMDCTDWLVTRMLPNGRLDPSFEGKGASRMDIGRLGPGGYDNQPGPDYDAGRQVEMLPSGRIIVGGNSSNGQIVVTRLDSDGRLDRSFGKAGKARPSVKYEATNIDDHHFTVSLNQQLTDLTVRKDGSLVVATGQQFGGPQSGYDREFNSGGLIALKPDGRQDHSFGKYKGSVRNFGLAISDISTDRCGRLTVGGTLSVGKFGDKFGVARYSRNGRLDRSFGTRRLPDPVKAVGDSQASTMALTRGRILLSGWGSTLRGNEQFVTTAVRTKSGGRCG